MANELIVVPSQYCVSCRKHLTRKSLECNGCAGVLNATYCSLMCLADDELRHQNECDLIASDIKAKAVVLNFKSCEEFNNDVYSVGLDSINCVEVQRSHRSISHRTDFCLLQTYSELMERQPESCSRPQISFGSATSVVVTWFPPINISYTSYKVFVQYPEHPWTQVMECHTNCCIVSDLKNSNQVQFRIEAGRSISKPSLPFCVGFADSSATLVLEHELPRNDFAKEEIDFFKTLYAPSLVQEYLDKIPMNHEIEDDTCLSPVEVIRQNHAHCIEAAMLAACILSMNGFPPYIMDLKSCEGDYDHCITPFQIRGFWGCISKSNHSSLRYRNPVYETLRELVMSYFDEYMDGGGRRTLRSYSKPLNLEIMFGPSWYKVRGDVFHVAGLVDDVKHYNILPDEMIVLRDADAMVMHTTVRQLEWPTPENFDQHQILRNVNK